MLITPVLSFPIFSNVKSTWTGEKLDLQKICVCTFEQMFKEHRRRRKIWVFKTEKFTALCLAALVKASLWN